MSVSFVLLEKISLSKSLGDGETQQKFNAWNIFNIEKVNYFVYVILEMHSRVAV